uniref:Molybdopterin biosynthesis protein n=1 Tax=Pterothamnion crispum TaxID=1550583 RepID=A0A4D6WY15_9FLOR|nr:Molybdopterin biosynthesis protein [Pterothamnion crispum]
MLNLQIQMTKLNEEEYQQYARHLVLDNIGLNGQKRLKNAKVLIVGAGGLGCPAILYLSASGIGCIGIIDYDKINLSNLNRQIIYNIENINEYKTDCTKLKIQKINKKCQINTYNYKLTKINAKHIIKNYDIVIDATDNFNTRYIIDKICYIYHKIHIYGAINKYEGQVSVFNYQNNIRYSDIYPQHLQLKNHNCNDIGILGAMTGIIGILQATEGIKIILGIGNIINGKILTYNLLNTSFKIVKIFPIKQNKIK